MEIINTNDGFIIKTPLMSGEFVITVTRWNGRGDGDNGDNNVVLSLTGGQVGEYASGPDVKKGECIAWAGNWEREDFKTKILPALNLLGKIL